MTIGHSVLSAEKFVALLAAHGVTAVADVRAVPRSRRHPHFSRERLQAFLTANGVVYEHFPGLGGHRTPRPDSPKGGWREEAFRGYADHMRSREFREALEALIVWSSKYLATVMCAESKWWQCHRQLIADALVARGVDVRHIMSTTDAPKHELTPFARVRDFDIEYPALV